MPLNQKLTSSIFPFVVVVVVDMSFCFSHINTQGLRSPPYIKLTELRKKNLSKHDIQSDDLINFKYTFPCTF